MLIPFGRSRSAAPAGAPPASPPQSQSRQRLASLTERRSVLVQQLHDAAEPMRLAELARQKADEARDHLTSLIEVDRAQLAAWSRDPRSPMPPPLADERAAEEQVALADREFHRANQAATLAKIACDAVEEQIHAVIGEQLAARAATIDETIDDLAERLDAARYHVASLEAALLGLSIRYTTALQSTPPQTLDERAAICGRLAKAKNDGDRALIAEYTDELAIFNQRQCAQEERRGVERSRLASTVDRIRHALKPRAATVERAANAHLNKLHQLESELIADATADIDIATEPANNDASAA